MTLLSPDPEQDDLQSEDSRYGDMTWISGGTFRMGSDRHYPEEAPVRRVTVDGFWIDRTPGAAAFLARHCKSLTFP